MFFLFVGWILRTSLDRTAIERVRGNEIKAKIKEKSNHRAGSIFACASASDFNGRTILFFDMFPTLGNEVSRQARYSLLLPGSIEIIQAMAFLQIHCKRFCIYILNTSHASCLINASTSLLLSAFFNHLFFLFVYNTNFV